jgi:hypothetical protein
MKEKLRRLLSNCLKYGIMIMGLLAAGMCRLAGDRDDQAYWRNVLAMAGAAAIAVAFVEQRMYAFIFGFAASVAGLVLDRKRRRKK